MKRLGLILGACLLLGGGILIGVAIKGSTEEDHTATESLKADQVGDVANGRRLFVTERCAACHSYLGKGGSDAPPLDFMRGHLAARDVANMSGRLWNHVPAMEKFFKAEDLPFPTFKGNEMADLVAYLHGGGSPPDMAMMPSDEQKPMKGTR